MSELINSMVETEAELIDIEVDDDGIDEIQVSEIEVEMMINELVEEVDMLYQRLLTECLLNEVEVHREITEVLLLKVLICNFIPILKINMLTIKNFNKTPDIRTFTVSWTEDSNPSSFNPVYSD